MEFRDGRVDNTRRLRNLLGVVWRSAPRHARRLSVWLAVPRFAVTVGAVIQDERGRVLLLDHVFRKGSGWGVPGGFIEAGENPEEALRRELREEIRLELDTARIAFARTLRRPRQVEIIFRCTTRGTPAPSGIEIKRAAWFDLDDLPTSLRADQHRLIRRALES